MESQPQNPELRNNPENFHPCQSTLKMRFRQAKLKMIALYRIL